MSRLTLLTLAWFVGLGLFEWQPAFPFNIIFIPIALFILIFIGRRVQAAPLLVLLVVALGYGRIWLADWRPALAAWQSWYGPETFVIGVVDEEPTKFTGRVAIKVNVEGLTRGHQGAITEGPWETPLIVWSAYDIRAILCQLMRNLCAPRPSVRAWINLDRLPPGEGAVLFQYGRRVALKGQLSKAPVYDLFPYRETLARQGVYGVLSVDEVKLVPLGQRRPIREGAMAVRRYFDGLIQRLMRPNSREAGLLAGILIGLEGRLPDDTVEALRRTSLTHIVVVSGFNITILVGGLGILLGWLAGGIGHLAGLALKLRWFELADKLKAPQALLLPRSWSYVALHGVALTIYAVLVGLDPAPVRAALMGMVYVLAKRTGRPSTVLTSVAVTAWAITVHNPWAALDVGFQLSFAATLGLVLFQPVIHREMGWWPWLRPLPRGILAPTLAATLATAPIISLYFNQVSLIGLLANVLALPVQPLIMFIGLGAVGLGAVADGFRTAQSLMGATPFWLALVTGLGDGVQFMAQQIAGLTWALLYYTSTVAHGLAQAPRAFVEWRANVPGVVLMYGMVSFWALRRALDHKLLRTDGIFLISAAPTASATPIPTPAPTPPLAAPTPRPDQPWPMTPNLRLATPVVALGERAGRPSGPWRRPPRPTPPTPPRPGYSYGAPKTPIARQPLAPFEAHPRRPFEAPAPPRWLPWLQWRYGFSALAFCALLWGAWPLAMGRPDGLLHLTVLERGGTVIARTPNGNRLVIGGGSFASETADEVDWGQWPWDRRLEVLAATRMDRNFVETLTTLLGRYPVTVAITPTPPRTLAGDAWAARLGERQPAQMDVTRPAPVRTFDGVALDVIGYDEVEKAVVYRLSWGDIKFIVASGLRGPIPLAAEPAAVVLIDPRAEGELLDYLAQVYRPTLWLVHVEETGGNPFAGQGTLFQVVNLADSGPTTLTTDGQRLWLSSER